MKINNIIVLLVIAVYQVNAITILCTKSYDGKQLTAIFVEVVSANVAEIQAVNVTNHATANCTSTQMTVGGVTTCMLNITISLITQLEISPSLATANCFVTVPTAPDTVYTYSILTQQVAGEIHKALDHVSTGTCDTSKTPSASVMDITGGVLVA